MGHGTANVDATQEKNIIDVNTCGRKGYFYEHVRQGAAVIMGQCFNVFNIHQARKIRNVSGQYGEATVHKSGIHKRHQLSLATVCLQDL